MNRYTLVCQVILLCICAVITSACAATQPGVTATPTVDMHKLLIDDSAFPPNWWLCMGPWPFPERARGEHGELEILYTQFCHEPPGCQTFGADQRLFRYRSESEAGRAFESDFSLQEFPDLGESMLTPWAVPEGWSYQSRGADRLKFACAQLDMGPVGPPEWRCTAVAQYHGYISALNSTLSPHCMTLEDLERILVAIDERMGLYLEEDTE